MCQFQVANGRFHLLLCLKNDNDVCSQDVVRKIEKTVTGANDRPVKDVVIFNTHAEVVSEPFSVSKESA